MTTEILLDSRIEAPDIEERQSNFRDGYPFSVPKLNKMLAAVPFTLARMFNIRPGDEKDEFDGFYMRILPESGIISARVYIAVSGAENAKSIVDTLRYLCEKIVDLAFDELSTDPLGVQRKKYIDALEEGIKQQKTLDPFLAARKLHALSLAELKAQYEQLPKKRWLHAVS